MQAFARAFALLRAVAIALTTTLAVACVTALALPAHAQTPWPGLALGVSEAELQAALPGVQPARRPAAGPRGLRGLWTLPAQPRPGQSAAVPYDTIFFFDRERRLRAVEQSHAEAGPSCGARAAFDALVSELRASHGAALVAEDPASVTASWVAGDTDVVATLNDAPGRCGVRLVYRERVVKDAQEL